MRHRRNSTARERLPLQSQLAGRFFRGVFHEVACGVWRPPGRSDIAIWYRLREDFERITRECPPVAGGWLLSGRPYAGVRPPTPYYVHEVPSLTAQSSRSMYKELRP